MCHEKAEECSHEHGRGKYSANPARSVGQAGSDHFDQGQNQNETEKDNIIILQRVKDGIVEEVGIIPGEYVGEEIETFAIERREDENEQAETDAAYQNAFPRFVYLAEILADFFIDEQEPAGDESGQDAEQQVEWQILEQEVCGYVKVECGRAAQENGCRDGSRGGSDQNGYQGGHRQVDHQYFQSKDQAGKRCAEYARNGSGRTASDQ